MAILTLFLLRLSFGLAVGMAITSPKLVPSGYFRNHLYVLLGLATLAALVSFSAAPEAFRYSVAAAVTSYLGSVCWLYEKKDFGRIALILVALASLCGTQAQLPAHIDSAVDSKMLDRYVPAIQHQVSEAEANQMAIQSERMGFISAALQLAANITSGLLMGTTLAAMLLGHWYLNTPTMELAPLRRLLLAMGVAVLLQALVSVIGMACEFEYATTFSNQWLLFVVLRWSFGIVGVAALTWMAWQTLKIPNTQSATGILYVAVIGVFVGELTALLLSAESAFPV